MEKYYWLTADRIKAILITTLGLLTVTQVIVKALVSCKSIRDDWVKFRGQHSQKKKRLRRPPASNNGEHKEERAPAR